jgi:gliding motility-associated-like protein
MAISRFLFVLVALILLGSKVSAQVVNSDFASNADGWTAPNALSAALNYSGTGGNPNGYVFAQTPGSIVGGAGLIWIPYYLNAPAKFLGAKSAYYGGGLSFDLSQTTSGAATALNATVVITDVTGVSIYFWPTTLFKPPAFGTWQTFEVPLSATTGEWKTTNSSTGTAATAAQILSVLTNINSLQVQGLYSNANVVTRFDNINMYPALTVTTQPTSVNGCFGTPATFTAVGGSNPTLTYKWQFLTVVAGWQPISDGTKYTNTATSTLTVDTSQPGVAGSYRCLISGIGGVDDLASNAATLVVNSLPTAPTTTGAARCAAGTVTLSAAGGSAGQYRWYTVASGGTAIAGQTSATYSPSLLATTNYYVAINNGTCESTGTLVTGTVNVTTPPTVTDGSRCGAGIVTLTAAGGTNGQYRWYNVASGGTAIAGQTNSTYSPSLASTTPYYVSIDNGTCESARTTVNGVVNTIPTAPTVTDGARCGTGTVTLTAAGGSAGQYRWYSVPTGGTAIAGQTASTYSPSLATTTPYYVSIDNGTCESARTTVNGVINTIPTAPTVTDGARCGTGTVTLTAAGGSAGQYRWYSVPTGGTAIAGQTASTYSPSLATTTPYYVSIDNGTCESARTTVNGVINTIPTAPTVTDGARCGTGTVTLTAAGGSAGQYRWYSVPTGGTAIAGQTASTYSPSLATTTPYYVSIDNGTCESARTTVNGVINTIPTAPTVTDGARCGTGTVTLTAAGGSAGQYRWYSVPTGGTAIAGQTASTYLPSLASTTPYYVSIDNGTCESARTTVNGVINTIPTAPTVTDGARCGTGTVTLTAAGGSAGQYRWYSVPTGGTAIAGQTASTYSPSLASTTPYYVSIDNGTCESARTTVNGIINTIPTAPTVTDGARCGTGTVTLTAAGGSAGQYRWYSVPTGGTAIVGQTSSTYSPSLTTTTSFYVSIDNGTCESVRTTVNGVVNTIPTAPTTTGASRCGTGTVTLTAAGGTNGQYRWYSVSSGGTAIAGQTNSTYSPSLAITTTYYASIDNGTCESPRTAVVGTINTIPTAPTVTNGSRCGTGTVTLTAAGGTNGQYRWYSVSSGGTAIAGQTNSTYSPSLTTTTGYYVSIDNGTCESSRTTVSGTINTIPTAPTVTDGSRCGTGTVTLTASGGSAGQYRWYSVPTGGTAIAGQTGSTYSPSLITTTSYYVSINNGTCESSRTTVAGTVNTVPSAPGVTDGGGCIPASVTLSASGGLAGEYRWYTVPTGGTALVGETNSTYTTPTLSSTTTYYVSIDNGLCEGPRASVNATLGNPPAAPTITGGSACSPGIVTLSAGGASAGEYRWYTSPTGGTAISGETNSTYNTPTLSATTTYYVALNNGCEGPRTAVVATLNTPPSAPTATGDFSCVAASITLTASGASAGQYRWYNVSAGGTAISGATNSTFATPVISTTTTFYVAINDGTCESPRTAVAATIGGSACTSNSPPVIETTEASTVKGGKVTINLADLVTDTDDNLVLSTLSIVSQPSSGATATIDSNFNLVIDYAGKPFSGTESITISVCDSFSACTQQTLSIDVIASINVYNAVSPNKDGKNDLFFIDGIDKLEDTKVNRVLIFNRWGDVVWEGTNYDNSTVVFSGESKGNIELPSGVYFYRIEFPGGNKKSETGSLTLKR